MCLAPYLLVVATREQFSFYAVYAWPGSLLSYMSPSPGCRSCLIRARLLGASLVLGPYPTQPHHQLLILATKSLKPGRPALRFSTLLVMAVIARSPPSRGGAALPSSPDLDLVAAPFAGAASITGHDPQLFLAPRSSLPWWSGTFTSQRIGRLPARTSDLAHPWSCLPIARPAHARCSLLTSL